MIVMYFAYFAGISFGMFLATYIIFQLYGAFSNEPFEPIEMKSARMPFLRNNGWQLLVSFIVVCVLTVALWTDVDAAIRFNSPAEVIGFGGLVMCGTVLWTLLYDLINRLGTRLEILGKLSLKQAKGDKKL